jgi:hypothetical protein
MRRLLSFLALLCVPYIAPSAQPHIAADSVLTPIAVDSVLTQTSQSQTSQSRKLSLIRRIVRGFDRLDNRYIEPQHYVFAAMLQATRTLDIYTLRSSGANRQSMTFGPDADIRIGPYAGWKWFFMGYTFSLNNMGFSNDRQEFDFSVYSSQIGIDLFYRHTGSNYKLRDANLGRDIDASVLNGRPFSGLKSGITGFNIYYIFNHGRFSYPAAFAQSTIQKISCGSWLAGFGYTRNSIEFDHESLQAIIDHEMKEKTVPLDSGLMFKSVKYYDFSRSGGYAYNWVFARNWLLGASIQAAIAHKRSSGQVAGTDRDGFSFRNINLDGIGRFGLVYNNMRWYAGTSIILHTYNYHKSRFSTNNTFGSMNVYLGCNFGLKKKYKKQKL